jgi:hypothetical protein
LYKLCRGNQYQLNASLTDQANLGNQIDSIDLVFANGRTLSTPIILGGNIREWTIDRSRSAVTTTTSPAVREASRTAIYLPPPEDRTVTGIVDLLTI